MKISTKMGNSNGASRSDLPSDSDKLHTESDDIATMQKQALHSTFMDLLREQSEIIKEKNLPVATVLGLFDDELSIFAKKFVNRMMRETSSTDAASEPINTAKNTRETIGDSTIVSPHRSQPSVPQVPEGMGMLFCRNKSTGDNNETVTINEEQFVSACFALLQLDNESQKTHYYFDLSTSSRPCVNTTECGVMLDTCCAASTIGVSQPYEKSALDKQIIPGLIQDMFCGKSELTADELHSWIISNNVYIFDNLHSHIVHTLQNYTTTLKTNSRNIEGTPRKLVCDTLRWLLSLTLPDMYLSTNTVDLSRTHRQDKQKLLVIDGWESLYDSDEHGLSINRFEHHVSSYHAPTVFIVTADGAVFYVTSSTDWRKSSGKFGGTDCCFVQIFPKFVKICDCDMLTWVDNPRHPSRGITLQKSGSSSPLMRIPHDFTTVACFGLDYHIHRIQVFGCGNESARTEQLKQREWEKRQVQKSQQQKLHLEPNWQENADKKILEMAGITTHHSQR